VCREAAFIAMMMDWIRMIFIMIATFFIVDIVIIIIYYISIPTIK